LITRRIMSEGFPMETLYVLLIFPIRVTCHTHPILLNLIIIENGRRRVQIRPCRSPCYVPLSSVPLLPPFRCNWPQLARIWHPWFRPGVSKLQSL
jgi:hypothetical protein